MFINFLKWKYHDTVLGIMGFQHEYNFFSKWLGDFLIFKMIVKTNYQVALKQAWTIF